MRVIPWHGLLQSSSDSHLPEGMRGDAEGTPGYLISPKEDVTFHVPLP